MSNKAEIINKFHQYFIRFIDELVEQFPEVTTLHFVRIFLKDRCEPFKLIENYIKYILPEKALIDARDDSFFLHAQWLDKLTKKGIQISALRDIWLSNHIDNSDKEMIWKWYDVFNVLSLRYKELYYTIHHSDLEKQKSN